MLIKLAKDDKSISLAGLRRAPPPNLTTVPLQEKLSSLLLNTINPTAVFTVNFSDLMCALIRPQQILTGAKTNARFLMRAAGAF